MVREHQLTVIAIGNGTGCRETEEWISELIAGELAAENISYVIVNEAGASVYSTSQIGREEFPTYDATLRGAISIGRRLQDPLCELVKIDPANIGVGMYQHDVKAKHLRDSLDAVVESCVNFVGVDLNTASPALLRYVSGLNQLTAQRLVTSSHDEWAVYQPRAIAIGARIRRGGVRAGGRFLEDRRRRQSARRHLDSPRELSGGQAIARDASAFKPADLADKAKDAELAERLSGADLPELAQNVHVGTLTLGRISSVSSLGPAATRANRCRSRSSRRESSSSTIWRPAWS